MLWPDTVNKWSWSLICPRWYANGCCGNVICEYPLSLINHLWWSLYPANVTEEFFVRKVPLSFTTVHLHVVDIGRSSDKWVCGAWSSTVSKLLIRKVSWLVRSLHSYHIEWLTVCSQGTAITSNEDDVWEVSPHHHVGLLLSHYMSVKGKTPLCKLWTVNSLDLMYIIQQPWPLLTCSHNAFSPLQNGCFLNTCGCLVQLCQAIFP